MRSRKVTIGLASGITLALVLLALVGLAGAQTGSPNDDDGAVLSPAAVAVVVNDVVQVQGRLTDASGRALNSTVVITTSIYDVSAGGTARCSDDDLTDVVNGLFTMAMDFCTASDFNGDQLYLGIKVGADAEMTPRQEIFAVPYAWGLRPGAIVKGADSYVFVPGAALVKNASADTTRWDIQANGAALIYRGAATGDKTIYLPITLPGVLYGQNMTLVQLTVYYKSTANSFITYTDLNLQTDADSWLGVVDDTTDLKSTTAASYSIPLSANNVLNNSQGILGLYMYLTFANDAEPVELGGVRLRISHQ